MITASLSGNRQRKGFLEKKILLLALFLVFTATASIRIHQNPDSTVISVKSNLDAGPGTLRQALLEAQPGTAIYFSSDVFPKTSPKTINILSPYPPLDDGYVTIDASDAGVVLDGSKLSRDSEISALDIISDHNTIKGLEIVHFTASAIFISGGAKNNIIGGTGKGEGNILGGNLDGINIIGEGSTNNIVIGNLIGTDRTGMYENGNRAAGVWIGMNASDNIIGGQIGIEGNVISGNDSGIIIQYSNKNTVSGNLIGTDITGKRVLIQKKSTGIGLNFAAENNVIGGEGTERNLISGNGDGISLTGKGVSQNRISGNNIGLDITGKTALGNLDSGIHIMDGANGNQIGPYNKIAFNQKVGVVVDGPASINNRITQNSIYANMVAAILNRYGGNIELAEPVISLATPRMVQGQAAPNQRIEIFSDPADECEFFEGFVNADASGAFTFKLPSGSFRGRYLSVTAADQGGNTSQLSKSKENPSYGLLEELPGIIAPEQVSAEPAVIGTNLALAVFSVIFFGFTSSVFNEIMKNYNQEIANSLNRILPQGIKKRPQKTRGASVGSRQSAWTFKAFWLVLILLTALIESFLDPHLNLLGADHFRLVMTLFIAGLVASGLEWTMDHYAHQSLAQLEQTSGEVNWTGILFAIASVTISRMLHFTPGYIYGILGAVYLLPEITGRIESGKRALLIQSVIFLCGLVLWFSTSLLPTGLAILEPVLLTIFLITLQGTFFEMLPLPIFDGFDLLKWKKGLWAALFSAVLFCFYHFSLNPDGRDVQALQQNGVQILCLAMVIFGLVTLSLWLYFPYRLRKR